MNMTPLYRLIAQAITAHKNCAANKNQEWYEKWSDLLDQINDLLPSGSGIDSGCHIDTASCTSEKIVISSSVHYMDENGMYAGWQEFQVIIRPSFQGIDLRIQRVGPNNKDGSWAMWQLWRDGLYEQFQYVLTKDVIWDESGIRFAREKESVQMTA